MNRKRIIAIATAAVMLLAVPVTSTAASKSNEKTVYKYLTKNLKLNKAVACGVMTNLQAESGMKSDNLENKYNVRFGLSDAEYTKRVNKGLKKKGKYKTRFGKTRYFTKDYCGYGICQWTSLGRRQNLLNKALKMKVGVDNLPMQLSFLGDELKTSYPQVWTTLKKAPNTSEGAYLAATHFCVAFEVPAFTNTTAARRGKKTITGYWKNYSGIDVKMSRASYFGLCGYKYPKNVKKGTSFKFGGHAIANHKIKSVTLKVYDSKCKKIRSKTLSTSTTAVPLTRLNKYGKFQKLDAGNYTFVISAKDKDGRIVSAKHAFTVKKKTASSYDRGFSCRNSAKY